MSGTGGEPCLHPLLKGQEQRQSMPHPVDITHWSLCMGSFIRRLMLAAALVLLPVTFAYSLHEIDHRYDVTGFILDAEQNPVAGVPVVAEVDGKRTGSGQSDSNGHFRFRMHLHDSDVGREIRLKTPDDQGTVRVTLTPGDSSTQRVHHINFIGGQLVEGELPGRGGVSISTLVAVGAAVLVVGGLLAGEKMRRAHRRRLRAARQSEHSRESKASRRRKRKGKKRRR
jgi:hypothetical protein